MKHTLCVIGVCKALLHVIQIPRNPLHFALRGCCTRADDAPYAEKNRCRAVNWLNIVTDSRRYLDRLALGLLNESAPLLGMASYMAGLYYALGIDDINGFMIKPADVSRKGSGIRRKDYDLREKLLINGEFKKLSFGNRNYTYPVATDETTLWSFNLMHNRRDEVCSFDWIDYRGGDFLRLFTPDNDANADRELLYVQIKLSKALIVFVDA